MAKTKTSSEEIIEKKESTPVASASLILSFVAILAAIVFCLLEVTDYRNGLSAIAADSATPGMSTAKRDLDALRQRVNGILSNQALPEDDEEFDEEDDEEFDEEFDEDEEEEESDEEEEEELDEEEEVDEDF